MCDFLRTSIEGGRPETYKISTECLGWICQKFMINVKQLLLYYNLFTISITIGFVLFDEQPDYS